MADIKTHRVRSIREFHQLKGLPQPAHPLISVIDYGAVECISEDHPQNYIYDFYNISIKRGINGKLKYGQQQYDFDNGVMFFIAPDQVFRVEPAHQSGVKRTGWMLLIHPDFLWKTSLAKNIRQYEFFDYSVNEALFLSDREETTVNGILSNIQQEYLSPIDTFSQRIIISHLETLLNYSERFYQRQFITRKISGQKVLDRLEKLLTGYFDSDDLATKGLPSVAHIADTLNVSPKYLSSLLKSLTGQSTQQHIHNKLIQKAKEKLSTTTLTVGEIAYALGFEHSQSFSKLFKTKTDLSPLAFRESFN